MLLRSLLGRGAEQKLGVLKIVINFIDDILIYAPSKEVHDIRLDAVLKRLKEYNVTLNDKKYKSALTAVIKVSDRLHIILSII